MKKVILIALLCLIAIPKVVAQEMPSVAGVTFGWTYEQCKKVLDARFNGGESSYQFRPNEITYYDVEFGGYYYDCAQFEFQIKNGRSYLYYAAFYENFKLSESEAAIKMRDDLFEIYSKKYNFRWPFTNDDGYEGYVMGEDPFKPENGFLTIRVFKGENRKGDKVLWAGVYYGPIEFVKPEDEI